MVSINYASREVCCKIVYYGPGLSGKTTNLQYVHSKVPASTRGKMISLATEADRTLYFDFLPINIGTINGFAAKFQLYTVPGQVYYNATRKLVLRGVDGIVFVADSQPDKMDENIESLSNLEENLKEYGYDINDIPLVIQYNKRDLPGVLPVEQLNARLNTRGWPYFEASATLGNGVFDTLKMIIKMVLEKAKSGGASRPRPVAAAAPAAASAGVGTAASSAPVSASPGLAAAPSPQATAPSSAAPAPEPAVTPSVEASKPSVASTPETKKTVEKKEVPQYRPYPGTESKEAKETSEKRITPAAFSPAVREETTDATIGQKAIKPTGAEGEDALAAKQTPIMSPSLRRRSRKKKRGFFKRLFGIK
jgi:hypothetical protein